MIKRSTVVRSHNATHSARANKYADEKDYYGTPGPS